MVIKSVETSVFFSYDENNMVVTKVDNESISGNHFPLQKKGLLLYMENVALTSK